MHCPAKSKDKSHSHSPTHFHYVLPHNHSFSTPPITYLLCPLPLSGHVSTSSSLLLLHLIGGCHLYNMKPRILQSQIQYVPGLYPTWSFFRQSLTFPSQSQLSNMTLASSALTTYDMVVKCLIVSAQLTASNPPSFSLASSPALPTSRLDTSWLNPGRTPPNLRASCSCFERERERERCNSCLTAEPKPTQGPRMARVQCTPFQNGHSKTLKWPFKTQPLV